MIYLQDKESIILKIELIGHTIKEIRKERNLTQEQLGELVGVKKAQISKIENSLTDARFETILKVQLFDNEHLTELLDELHKRLKN